MPGNVKSKLDNERDMKSSDHLINSALQVQKCKSL